jgi:anti-sigma regulatory factor (Ser/Thr protein kinase)
MDVNTSQSFDIADAGRVAEARRVALHWAAKAGFDEVRAGRFAILVSEVGSNLHKHAGGGELIISYIERNGAAGLEVFGLDNGPGMANVHGSMRDGCSTAGTAGTGLGALQRQSDEFDIFSAVGSGTAVWARIWSDRRVAGSPRACEIEGLAVAVRGENTCGDAWISKTEAQGTLILLSDGLGHGPLAAAASQQAQRIFLQRSDRTPAQLLEDIHRGIRSTRGAAAAIALLDHANRRVEYCGVGNISGIICGDKQQYMISASGTIGHTAAKFQSFSYAWPDNALVLMFSDGLQTRLSLQGYAGIMRRHPALVSALLYRDFKRGRDDASIVTVRTGKPA